MTQTFEQWDTIDHISKVANALFPGIEKVTDQYGPAATIHALAMTLGRWCSQQPQDHINAQGMTPRQLMHHQVDFYFNMGIQEQLQDLKMQTVDINKELQG